VLASHPIQYQAPLYKEISRRGLVNLDVAFLDSTSTGPYYDGDFGTTISWGIDLLDGYSSTFIECDSLKNRARWPLALARWLARHDIVVLHGHSNPKMLSAAAICRSLGIPYLLRGDSRAESQATGIRRLARHALATFAVRNAAGALPVGKLNAAFYDRYGHIPHFLAPYSVDNSRFRAAADAVRYDRRERIASVGLDPQRPVVIYSGKLYPGKRPLDAVQAIERCAGQLNLLILGDGILRADIRNFEARLPIRSLGFVNQADIPGWYACGDVLVMPSEIDNWGLVVNEGMACGLVPVVSDAVGCAPDLVQGVGEIFPTGEIDSLAQCLLEASKSAGVRADLIRRRLDQFTIAQTACGYERAALALYRRPRR
jgi:glycosyltransferase involved in cell wall biosynthesis